MEVDEQIRVFREFIEQTSYAQLLEAVRKGETSLVLNFSELITFNTEICEEILERPEELLKAAELAVKEFDFSQKVTKFTVRFRHLPSSQKVMIGEIRSKHLNKFIVVEGIIRQKTDVRPHVTAAKFECPSCGNILHILQLDKKYKEPSRCSCGRKGKFKEISKELVDGQGLVLEEAPDALESSQPKRINVFLKDDLVSPISEKRCSPGSRVRLAGRVMEVPVTLRTGGQATKYDIILEANFIESLQEDAFEMQISEKEQQKIEELAKSPKVLDLLAESLAPSIYGHEKIKEALILQLVGGSRKERPDGIVTRGDIHVLLCGDPGSGKCLHPRTKIVCADGSIETIQEIVENNSVSVRTAEALTPAGHFEVTSLNQQGRLSPQPVSLFWKRPAPDILLKVKTASGSEIVVTENHPFFVTENGIVFSKQAHLLRNTDFIATPRTLPITGKLQEIQTTIIESKARNKRKITFPRVCDEGVARLLGYLVGDGYLAYSQTSGWVSLTNNDSLLLDDFKHLLEEKCNAKVIERKPHPGKSTKENYATSIELVRHFEQLEPTLLLKSAGKRAPKIICRSPNTVVKSFLRVLFDCEGSVHVKKGCIEISSASKDLMDDVRILLLRFGIISFRNVKEKCAANTQAKMKNPTTASGGVSNGLGFSSGKIPPIQTQSPKGAGYFSEIRRAYYELQIYGEHVDRFFTEIGFSSTGKMDALSKICLQAKKHNTNTDVIPHVGEVLSLIRKQNSLFQKDLGVPRTTYMHYERGDRNPSRQNFQTVVKNLKSSVRELSVLTELLDELAQAEIFWDKVEEVIPIPSDCAYVYDFQVEEAHNYVANAIVVHNSQILKRILKVAPKARFTSGKGASAAGLCVAPDSLVMTNPNIQPIENFVETALDGNIEEHQEGIWKARKILPKKVLTLDQNFKIRPKVVAQYWKLQTPPSMIEITTKSGKKIAVTPNTQLFTIYEGLTEWKKSELLKTGEYIATARKIEVQSEKEVITSTLIGSDPIVYGCKKILKEIIEKIANKYGTKRNAAKKLGLHENLFYTWWVREDLPGNPRLNTLKKLSEEAGCAWENVAQEITGFSLYNGKKITLPKYCNENLLYFAGLIAGDGDLSKGKNSISIRFSSSSKELINSFKHLAKELFGVPCNYSSKQSILRPTSVRFSSILVAEILQTLGVPLSPKSHKIDLSAITLHLPDACLKAYLRGLFDTDGSVIERGRGKKSRGCSYVDLTTTSKTLAKKLPLVLLRYGIRVKVRKREVSGKIITLASMKTIHQKHDQYRLEIKGKGFLEKFQQEIGFAYSVKAEKLQRIIEKISKYDTNTDVIPGIQKRFFNLCKKYAVSSKQLLGYKKAYRNFPRHFSTIYTQRLVKKLQHFISPKDQEFKAISQLSRAPIFWEKIKEITSFAPEYPYVYDVTVNNSHNFLVNGFVVHNTASVIKDEFLGGWSLEAGTLVLANRGFAIIDELDKMSKEDRSALHEALEQQQVSIAKANIQATLKCETTVLAAANPKFGRFDPYDLIASQIDLPPTLLNRFDLIFPIKDLPGREKDEKTASFILQLHKDPESATAPVSSELLKKYIGYARSKINPKMSDAAILEIKEYYISMRNAGGSEERGIRSVPITARQLEALVRLAEASAKVRLSKTVSKKDAQKAIELLDYCLNQIAKDSETGKIDIDRLSSTMTASQRGGIALVKEIISALEEQSQSKVIPVENVIEAAREKNISPEQVEEILEKLRRSGDIFEPKRGFVQRL